MLRTSMLLTGAAVGSALLSTEGLAAPATATLQATPPSSSTSTAPLDATAAPQGSPGAVATPSGSVADAPASAQDGPASAPSAANPDIVVTARQRSESLNRVPVAVTALSNAAIVRNNATTITKIVDLVPQVQLNRVPSGNGGAFVIRGISSSPQDSGVEQAVSIAIDGVQISRGRAVTAAMFDLQQVEVLKGPQALFFGKNAPAGVVAISSARPTERLSGYVTAGYEFKANQRWVEGAISGPLAANLKARLAGRFDQMDGWIHNVATAGPNVFTPFQVPGPAFGTGPANKSYTGRATIEWTPLTDFTATLRVTAGHATGNGEGSTQENLCANGNALPVSVRSGIRVVDVQSDCKLNGRVSIGALPPQLAMNMPNAHGGTDYNENTTKLASLDLAYRTGPVSFQSISAYGDFTSAGTYQCSLDSFATCFAFNGESFRIFSQQVRATSDFDFPINFTVGAYYDHVRRIQRGSTSVAYVGLDPVNNSYYSTSGLYHNINQSYSAFAQLRWNILPNLELAGGARYTRENKSATIGNVYGNPKVPSYRASGNFLSTKFKDSNVSPEATLSWHPTTSSTIYAAFKTGFLSGGISNPGTITTAYTADNLLFKSVTTRGGEIGAKGSLFDRRLSADLTVYRYNFKNLQVTSIDSTIPTFRILNAASARTTGVEFNTNFRATSSLSLRSGLGYNRAIYSNFPGAPCYTGQTAAQGCIAGVQDLSGHTLTKAPRWGLSFGATDTFHLNSQYSLELSGDGIYTSQYLGAENLDPASRQGSFWRANASLTLRATRGWSIGVVGRNLTNKYYLIHATGRTFGSSGEITATEARPREIAVQARYDF